MISDSVGVILLVLLVAAVAGLFVLRAVIRFLFDRRPR